jgi:hypothetical protein
MPTNKRSISRSITSAKQDLARQALNDFGAKSFRKFTDDLKVKSSTPSNFKVGNAAYTVGVLAASYAHEKMRNTVGVEKNTETMLSGGNNIQLAKQFKTVFEYGRRASKAMKMLATQNGTLTKTIHSTETQAVWRDPADARVGLSQNYGFNQKMLLVPGRTIALSVKRAMVEFGLDPEPILNTANTIETIYGMCLEERIKHRILNTSTYFPTNVTVRLISTASGNDDNSTFHSLLESIGSTVAPVEPASSQTQTGRIPGALQFSGIVNSSLAATPPRYFSRMVVDPEANINSAPDFRSNFSVAKTFSKKLMPGDIWDIDITRHTGSGWNLTQMATLEEPSTQEDSHSVGLLCLIEAKGIPCECSTNINAVEPKSYIGTSPGWLQFESKTDLKFINRQIESINNTVGITPNYAIRGFVKEITPTVSLGPSSKKFNKDASEIGLPTGPIDKFNIPLISDKDVKYAREI